MQGMERLHEGKKRMSTKKCMLNGTRKGLINKDRNVMRNGMEKDSIVYFQNHMEVTIMKRDTRTTAT